MADFIPIPIQESAWWFFLVKIIVGVLALMGSKSYIRGIREANPKIVKKVGFYLFFPRCLFKAVNFRLSVSSTAIVRGEISSFM